MKKIIMVLIGCIYMGACTDNHGATTQAGKIYTKFARAKTVEEKAKYVLYKEEMLPYMKKYYGGRQNISQTDYQILEENQSDNWTSFVVQDNIGRRYSKIMKKEGNTWKLDWQGSTGYTPLTIREFKEIRDYGVYTMYVGVSDANDSVRMRMAMLGQILPNINDHFIFTLFSANITNGLVEKQSKFEVDSNDILLGFCPKKIENCKKLNQIFVKNSTGTSCGATVKIMTGAQLILQTSQQMGHNMSSQEKRQLLDVWYYQSGNMGALINDIEPNEFCLTKQK